MVNREKPQIRKVLSIKPDGKMECLPEVLMSFSVADAKQFLNKKLDIQVKQELK